MAHERVVYVVDDDAAVRRSLERLLAASGFKVIAYATAIDFINAAATLPAGCVLMDVRMPAINGLELQEWMVQTKVMLPVIMMTGQGDVKGAVRAMKSGAVDYIEKPYGDEILVRAIESALKAATSGTRNEDIDEAVARVAGLSRREREVLDSLVSGRPNKVIAFDLGISIRTVEVHRARMMDRLGVRQLAEAVRLAVLAKLAREE
jgi:two-component system response regulator FixJ